MSVPSFSLETHFDHPLIPPWKVTQIGSGRVAQAADSLALTLPAAAGTHYHDAQLSDYTGQVDFRWRPPLRMSVRARISDPHGLVGTAGFGFWNHPFVPGERGFRLPQAVWFFFSAPPSNMQLALDVPGPGWKAATIDTARWPFLALLPTAPVAFLLMRIPAVYRRLWPIGQRAICVSEHLLDSALLAEAHSYELEWQHRQVTFALDGVPVHRADYSARGPLGFIAWVDNQYAVVTPQGHFGAGLVTVPHEQTLILEKVKIEAGY